RMLEAAFVEANGLVVIAGQVVGVCELEQGARVVRVELDGALQALDGLAALALPQENAGELEVVLGAVAAEGLELGKHLAGGRQVDLEGVNGERVEVELCRRVAGFLRALERLERLFVILARRQGPSEIEIG